jgi:hypothetical protein
MGAPLALKHLRNIKTPQIVCSPDKSLTNGGDSKSKPVVENWQHGATADRHAREKQPLSRRPELSAPSDDCEGGKRHAHDAGQEQESKRGVKNWWDVVQLALSRWGMNERRNFNSEKEAVDWAREVAKKIDEHGAEPEFAKDKLELAKAYQSLTDKLSNIYIQQE